MVAPEHQQHTGERYSAGKSESRSQVMTHGFALEDHREQHVRDEERLFAADVARTSSKRALNLGASELIVVADPRMLGMLRTSFETVSHGLQIKSLAKELSKLTPKEIEDHLLQKKLIPPRKDTSPVTAKS